MQSVSSRNWTRVAVSISYDDNHYTTGTSSIEPSLPYYLPIAGGRIIRFIPFSRVLVLCEMQSVSSRNWTRVAVSISYDNNHYTTGTLNIEPSLPYYLPIAGGRIIGFIPFSNVLVLCEMQSVSSRNWTRVDVSISYDDNHYTTGTSYREPHLPYYLPIAGGRIIGFIPFSKVLVLCEMQSVSSKNWTRVAVSISYDDNHYTTGTSNIEPRLPYYLPIAGGRIIGFIAFSMVLVLCEMQSVSSRNWTRVTMSISYDDYHYTTGTSILLFCLWSM